MVKKKDATQTVSAGKREAILSAALAVFLESGYAASSMDMVAARAGVSKATVYAHFNSKEELFGALVGARCDRCFAKVAQPDIDAAGGLEAALVQIATDFFEMTTAPEALGMFRVVVAETPRFPEVGKAFYHAGPAPGLEAMSRFFAEVSARGLLDVPDPRLAAEFFVGMLRSETYLCRLLGLPGPSRPLDETIRQAVGVVMRAYAKT